MQLELLLSNDPRAMPGVRAFAHETLRQLPLSDSDSDALVKLVSSAVEDASERAYPAGEEGSIRLTIREQHGLLEMLIRDYGMPQDIDQLERRLHEANRGAPNLFGCPTAGLLDEVHWLAYGPRGKALELRKWLHETSIEDHLAAGKLDRFEEDAPLAPPQEYVVRRLKPEDAVGVSQLMYRSYGNTYFNPDVYYPERVAAQNAHGTLVSIVAQGANGYIAGHFALELNQPGPVAELGQAVVDPAHRSRGLMNRMMDAAIGDAGRMKLAGWYADAVAVHTLTQKSNVSHGARLACVDLAMSPKSEQFHHIAQELPQRVTCMLYFYWLSEAAERTAYVPRRHRETVAAIYDNLQCPLKFAETAAPRGHGQMAVKINDGAARAVIRPDVLGEDTVAHIRHAKRELVERSHMELVALELPIEDPATAYVIEQAEIDGFGFIGIGPHFSQRGDVVRLVYLVEPLARDPIKTYEPFAHQLVNYALAEQARVQAEL